MTIGPTRFWATVLLLSAVPALARGEIIELRTSQLCKFKISAVTVTDAAIIGDRESVLVFLESRQVYVHSCEWLLAPVKGMSETQYVMEKGAKRTTQPGAHQIAINHVLVEIAHAEEFLAVFAASGAEPPIVPPVGPPGGTPLPAPVPLTPEPTEQCKGEKLCVKRDGHAVYEMKCGPLEVELSTDGAFGIGIKKGPVKLSIETESD